MLNQLQQSLQTLKNENTFRELFCYDETYLDFSSNDYLGFSYEPALIEAGCLAAKTYGAGSTGSRLLSGNKNLFENFEDKIAENHHQESALIFNSGFDANLGVLSSLLTKDMTVIFDKLNHASLYQGAFLSGARLQRYHHLDYHHLEKILQENSHGRSIAIVSESVFGMDGDFADLKTLNDLAVHYKAILYLDEAHATGLYGKNGYGLSTLYTLDPQRTLIMGAFSKALGGTGAYVTCSLLFREMLIQKCKPFIYSTALSPFCIGAARWAWENLPLFQHKRAQLLEKSQKIRERIRSLGYTVLGDGSNIIPILYQDIESMLEKKNELFRHKIVVSGIRRPTSPTPRLRLAIRTRHTDQNFQTLIENLA